ncbi:hypothetical protein F0235_02875 [Vibrio splendidus]|uniref:hypothetical protein n=1 Tax=Vibrio splendidus TaxID=29497 RepID=UPI00148BD409|nr:hypothetical protein [Vibrio splendidus]NOI89384.1 hypothetical protein [Vibrio splendidus]
MKSTIVVCFSLIFSACGDDVKVVDRCNNFSDRFLSFDEENLNLDWFSENESCISEKNKKAIVERLSLRVKSIPRKNIIDNYKGYKILSILQPENQTYLIKSGSYRNEIFAFNQGLYLLPIKSDPNATYWVLDKNKKNSMHTIVTKRIGSTGIGYSKRLIDCSTRTIKYLSTIDGGKGLFYVIEHIDDHKHQEPKMYSAYSGTIASEVIAHVCSG